MTRTARTLLAQVALLVITAGLLLLLTPSHARGQSTPVGRGFFSAFDVFWEKQQARNPWLRQIDNADWKSWLVHGAVTEVAGYGLSKATPMSFRRGRQVLAAFYVARELYNIACEGNRKYGDAFMDAAVPAAVAVGALRVQVRF